MKPRISLQFFGMTYTPGAGAPADELRPLATVHQLRPSRPAPGAPGASLMLRDGAGRTHECEACGEFHEARPDGLCVCQKCGFGMHSLSLLDGFCGSCDPDAWEGAWGTFTKNGGHHND